MKVARYTVREALRVDGLSSGIRLAIACEVCTAYYADRDTGNASADGLSQPQNHRIYSIFRAIRDLEWSAWGLYVLISGNSFWRTILP